jgi:hypothetical protein
MLISLTLISRDRKHETWLLTTGTEIHRVKTERSRARDTLTTLRYVINRTLKLNSTDYIFLGNRRFNGMWLTEWFKHRDSIHDLEIEAHSLNTHNTTAR